MGKRWIKLWVHESLEGTIRFDFSPEERAVWYDLLLLAGRCRREGIIAPSEGAAFPHLWIAGTLNISQELLDRTLKKCIETERIKENSNGIEILNWAKYQSEYDRQKPYRQGKAALLELKQERKRLGLCELCGEEGHNKYNCPHSKFSDLVER